MSGEFGARGTAREVLDREGVVTVSGAARLLGVDHKVLLSYIRARRLPVRYVDIPGETRPRRVVDRAKVEGLRAAMDAQT